MASNKQAKWTFRFEMRHKIKVFLLVSVLGLGCSPYGAVIKGSDYEAKRKMALELYQKEKYKKALPLFEELFGIIRGSNTAEETHYHLAYTYYGVGDMLLANYYFGLFVKNFPKSKHREEAMYMSALSLYKASPRYNLDQTSSLEAIQAFQNFVDMYPESPRMAEANGLVDELLGKLEMKMFRQAVMHYKRQEFRAAITTFETLLQDFPDSDRRFEVYYTIVKASYEFAELSVKQRKWSRYADAIEYYSKFADRLAGTSFEAPAKVLKEKAEAAQKALPKPTEEDA